jgi:DNA repair exonuclease SbcCD ATPase subunit
MNDVEMALQIFAARLEARFDSLDKRIEELRAIVTASVEDQIVLHENDRKQSAKLRELERRIDGDA